MFITATQLYFADTSLIPRLKNVAFYLTDHVKLERTTVKPVMEQHLQPFSMKTYFLTVCYGLWFACFSVG